MKAFTIILLSVFLSQISSKTASEFLNCVKAQLGKPYVYGDEGPNTFDCSGLVYYCMDYKTPRTARGLSESGSPGDGSPGDLVFFGESIVTHVGIVVGGGQMIHAPQPGEVVSYRQYHPSDWYDPRFKGYKRYVTSSAPPITPSTPSSSASELDPKFYSIKYPDLAEAFGQDADALTQHWLQFGKKEGRSPNVYLDPIYYSEKNEDLALAFGDDFESLIDHFYQNGINEGRISSPIYFGVYYRNKYPDLKNHGYKDLLQHFLTYGMKEGRQAHPEFDVSAYMKKNPDLVKVFGNDIKAYYEHYLEFGMKEGRGH